MSKLIPLIFLLLGTGAGIAAGFYLAPPIGPAEHEAEVPEQHSDEREAGKNTVFVKLNNQFVVPIVEDERVTSLVVMSLSIETKTSISDLIYEREPKLRDLFLRVMFDHANIGGFSGSFTQSDLLEALRASLDDVARKELGDEVESVLITNIARQDS